jgi:transposase
MVNVEFFSENNDDSTVQNLVVGHSLADDLLRIEISLSEDGEMTVEVFNLMNEGEGVFVNQFPLGG